MSFLGNLIWLLFGGLLSAIGWWLSGLIWCITIIGIPVGLQCFKLSALSLCPFGKDVIYDNSTVSFLINVIWFLVSGWELALGNLVLGCLLCITIIGIPFGMQFFKIAKLSLAPFGANIVKVSN